MSLPNLPNPAKTRTVYDELLLWLRTSEDFYVHPSVYIDTTDPNNRCLRTNQSHAPGTLLIRVPGKFHIEGEDMFKVCENYLQERSNPDSFFQTYFNALPTPAQLQDLPIYKYPVLNVKPAVFNEILVKFRNEAIKLWKEHIIPNTAIADELKTFHTALYTTALYHSRCWDKWGFIPFIDLIQHSSEIINANRVVHEDNNTCFYTGKFINSGDALTWCYSLNTNLTTFANYGITHEMAPQNYFISYITIDRSAKSPELLEFCDECLQKLNISSEQSRITFVVTTTLETNVLNIARLLWMDNVDFELIKDRKDELDFTKDVFITIRNELQVYSTLAKIMLEHINAFESMQGDDADPDLYALTKVNNDIAVSVKSQIEKRWMAFLHTF